MMALTAFQVRFNYISFFLPLVSYLPYVCYGNSHMTGHTRSLDNDDGV